METKLLITPEQVVELAFGCGCDKHLVVADIGEATIVAAESKFVVPVFGADMVEQMRSGSYAELVDCYLRPALALYVKYLVLPTLAVKVGAAGVVSYTGEGFEREGGRLIISNDELSSPSTASIATFMGSISSACSPSMTVLRATSYSCRIRSAEKPVP